MHQSGLFSLPLKNSLRFFDDRLVLRDAHGRLLWRLRGVELYCLMGALRGLRADRRIAVPCRTADGLFEVMLANEDGASVMHVMHGDTLCLLPEQDYFELDRLVYDSLGTARYRELVAAQRAVTGTSPPGRMAVPAATAQLPPQPGSR